MPVGMFGAAMEKELRRHRAFVVVGVVCPAVSLPDGDLSCQLLLLFHEESVAILERRVMARPPGPFTAEEIGEFVFDVSSEYGACESIMISPTVWKGSSRLVGSRGFPDHIVAHYGKVPQWGSLPSDDRSRLEQFAKAGGSSLQWLERHPPNVTTVLRAMYQMMYS